MKTVYVTTDKDGLFCIKREIRGETERMAFGTEHLKEELEDMGAKKIKVPELNKTYKMSHL